MQATPRMNKQTVRRRSNHENLYRLFSDRSTFSTYGRGSVIQEFLNLSFEDRLRILAQNIPKLFIVIPNLIPLAFLLPSDETLVKDYAQNFFPASIQQWKMHTLQVEYHASRHMLAHSICEQYPDMKARYSKFSRFNDNLYIPLVFIENDSIPAPGLHRSKVDSWLDAKTRKRQLFPWYRETRRPSHYGNSVKYLYDLLLQRFPIEETLLITLIYEHDVLHRVFYDQIETKNGLLRQYVSTFEKLVLGSLARVVLDNKMSDTGNEDVNDVLRIHTTWVSKTIPRKYYQILRSDILPASIDI